MHVIEPRPRAGAFYNNGKAAGREAAAALTATASIEAYIAKCESYAERNAKAGKYHSAAEYQGRADGAAELL